jgi:hypothetical protein
VRWLVIAIASWACACKGDPPQQPRRDPQPGAAAPSGAARVAEVDAAIDAMRPALLLAEPTETVSACVGPLDVVAIDHEAARLIAAGRPAPEGARFMTPPEISAVVRYAARSALSPDDVTAIRAWAAARPASFVWGFLDRTLVDDRFEGVLHVIDATSKSVLCHTPITAASTEAAVVARAVSEKLAVLRAGKDVVTLQDPSTDNRGPPPEAGVIGRDATGVCFTYRDLVAEKDAFACERTMKACLGERLARRQDRTRRLSQVSACVEVGSAATPR